MSDLVSCEIHGDRERAYVCVHLTGDSIALGFNHGESSETNPYPDAWCDNCEIIRADSGGWNEESEKLTQIKLLCVGCYQAARIRNTRTAFTLDDLNRVRWKCGSCEQWHTGPCLDFGFQAPFYWTSDESRSVQKFPDIDQLPNAHYLDEQYCVRRGDYFIRGTIDLPVIGTNQTFRWGVWGSLSLENFKKAAVAGDDRNGLPKMFSWLSTQLNEYPDTLNLKMYASFDGDGIARFELEPTNHPLAREFHEGILAERVKEIMLARLSTNG